MTEITRVALPPVAKGSLAKLWIGAILAVALGGAVAIGSREKGFELTTVSPGSGPSPTINDYVEINYVGHLANGKEFDRNEHYPTPVGDLIPGFTQALLKMQKGGKYHVYIPARLGYGAVARPGIPANSDLVFDVEVVDMKTAEEVQRIRALQQALQGMGQGGGAGAPPPPAGN